MPKSGKKTAKSEKTPIGVPEPVVLKDPLPLPLWLPPPEGLGERVGFFFVFIYFLIILFYFFSSSQAFKCR
jgi:hypothetical protein